MKIARVIAIGALAFLSVSAIVGAIPMILSPSGDALRMPLSLLEHSPFHSFLIPGIILLLANGVLSILVLVMVVRQQPGYGWFVAFQGCVVAGWIVVEVIMLQAMVWLHYLYLAVGLVLFTTGLLLKRSARPGTTS